MRLKAYLSLNGTAADGPTGRDEDSQLEEEVDLLLTMHSDEAIELASRLLRVAIGPNGEITQLYVKGWLEVDAKPNDDPIREDFEDEDDDDGDPHDYDDDKARPGELGDNARIIEEINASPPRPLYPLPLAQVEPGLYVGAPVKGPWLIERLLVTYTAPHSQLLEATVGGRPFFSRPGDLPCDLQVFDAHAFGMRLSIPLAAGETVRFKTQDFSGSIILLVVAPESVEPSESVEQLSQPERVS